jgi:hypothetical protein
MATLTVTTTTTSTTNAIMDHNNTNGHCQSPELQQQPRRNLTQAFEALCLTVSSSSPNDNDDEMANKEETSEYQRRAGGTGVYESSSSSSLLSPTGVADEHQQAALLLLEPRTKPLPKQQPPPPVVVDPNDATTMTNGGLLHPPTITLVEDLQRDLTDACVLRVSLYSIVHDINKEAAALATLDPLLAAAGSSLLPDIACPLLQAFSNQSRGIGPMPAASAAFADNEQHHAMIDEEKWLLAEVQKHHAAAESSSFDHHPDSSCPATFRQAMGEKEYDLPPHLVGRTQLWKPSRSWWEAKSGKNPWIQPSLHNQRWRYLWPLIHYHKFLAKCIKKLKRNSLDVTISAHPVSIFLRHEVCAVSDHLAAISLFGSELWMRCLPDFDGWIDTASNSSSNDETETTSLSRYRRYVQSLPLRSRRENAGDDDVDNNPVWRAQIDSAFSRAMQQQQINNNNSDFSYATNSVSKQQKQHGHAEHTAATESTTHHNQQPQLPPTTPHHHHHQPHELLDKDNYNHTSPKSATTAAASSDVKIPQQIHGVPPPRHFYRWYDANSVHSELSTNTSYSAAAAAAVAYTDYHHQLNHHHPHHHYPTLNHHPNLHNVYPLHLSYYPTPVDASVQHHQHLPPPTHSTAFYHHHAGQAAAAAPIPSPATAAYPWMSYYHPMYAYHEAATTTPAEENNMPVTPVSTATSGSHHHHQRHHHHSSAHPQYTTGGNDTTISSSPSWWAHLEQVAHMGMATPSTPRRPPRKTPHKSMTKS